MYRSKNIKCYLQDPLSIMCKSTLLYLISVAVCSLTYLLSIVTFISYLQECAPLSLLCHNFYFLCAAAHSLISYSSNFHMLSAGAHSFICYLYSSIHLFVIYKEPLFIICIGAKTLYAIYKSIYLLSVRVLSFLSYL